MTKISLGAGMEPEKGKGWINVDLLDLPGIDVVHNLMEFPWPFQSDSADYIKAKDLIEHLDHYVLAQDCELEMHEAAPAQHCFVCGKNTGSIFWACKDKPFCEKHAPWDRKLEKCPVHFRKGQPTIIAFIEECHRILKPGGTLWIQTPRHDALFMWTDPTHVRGFTEESMDFFDKTTDFGKSTGFYSKADFEVSVKTTENLNLQFTMVKR